MLIAHQVKKIYTIFIMIYLKRIFFIILFIFCDTASCMDNKPIELLNLPIELIPRITLFCDLPTINALIRCNNNINTVITKKIHHSLYKKNTEIIHRGLDAILLHNPTLCQSLPTNNYLHSLVHYAERKQKIIFKSLVKNASMEQMDVLKTVYCKWFLEYNYLKSTKRLMSFFNQKVNDKQLNSLMFYATYNNNSVLTQILLQSNNASPNDTTHYPNLDIIKLLVTHPKMQQSTIDKIFSSAAGKNKGPIVQFLLKNSTISDETINKAFRAAYNKKHPDIVNILSINRTVSENNIAYLAPFRLKDTRLYLEETPHLNMFYIISNIIRSDNIALFPFALTHPCTLKIKTTEWYSFLDNNKNPYILSLLLKFISTQQNIQFDSENLYYLTRYRLGKKYYKIAELLLTTYPKIDRKKLYAYWGRHKDIQLFLLEFEEKNNLHSITESDPIDTISPKEISIQSSIYNNTNNKSWIEFIRSPHAMLDKQPFIINMAGTFAIGFIIGIPVVFVVIGLVTSIDYFLNAQY